MDEGQRLEGVVEGHVGIDALFLETVQIAANVYTQQGSLRHVHVDIRAQVELLVVRGIVHDEALVLFQYAALLEIAGHDTVSQEVAAAADVQIAAGGMGIVLRDGVNPVHVGIEVGVIARGGTVDGLLSEGQGLAVAGGQLVEQAHILRSIQELGEHRGFADGVLHMETHLRRTNLATLRGDDDDAVGTTYTIHSLGRGILQHGERLHLGYIDIVQVAGHTVDKHQRGIAAVEGRHTANPEVGVVVARLTRALDADDATELTSQVIR